LEKQNIKQNDQILHGEVCDMNDFVMIGETSKKILEKMNNEIDVLICNAGTNLDKLAMRMDMSDWMKVINTNLNGNFKLISEFLRSMTSRKKGRIILISSVIASMGNMGQANYAASKAGLEGMMRCLAIETSRYNVTINAIAPGFIETPMTEKLPEQIKEAMLKRIPMNRYGKPEEIFNTVAFLSSDESSYITGQTIHVNGGMYFN
jgi:3-oxoacyl-[acyl-carrier protein] reductase